MFARNTMNKEAQELFTYLELRTHQFTKVDTLIIKIKELGKNHLRDCFFPQYYPLLGGTLLKFIGLILEFIEFIGDSFFYLIEVVLEISSIESANK